MLIAQAELQDGIIADVRISGASVAEIGTLQALPGETVLDANRALLLPGLHDHHIHMASLAASLMSVPCGPPDITTLAEFVERLRRPGTGWLRATGYHETVAGYLDAAMLDRIVGDRPVRIQHRSGRMWFLNSAALDAVLSGHTAPPGLEYRAGKPTGRLFDEDSWLRRTLGSQPPNLAPVGTMLARAGVTGLTDMSPANDAAAACYVSAEQASGALPQRVLLAGTLGLEAADMTDSMVLGPAKLHLHEAGLPSCEYATAFVRAAHAKGRPVAIHCTTEVELVFALAAIAEAGATSGDRIEHASITSDWALDEIARLGLAVVTQPNFIAERGDQYIALVEPEMQRDLYRLRAFRDAGVPLAGSSDAPFGTADPWASMAAAVTRRTCAGAHIGASEALTPEQAVDLFLHAPTALTTRRHVACGTQADLCLLDRCWSQARTDLASVKVAATLIGGRLVHERRLLPRG